MLFILSFFLLLLITIFVLVTSVGKSILEKFSIIRIWLMWEYLNVLKEYKFPLKEFSVSKKDISAQELLNKIATHYGLRCSFKLNVVNTLGDLGEGRQVAANIGIPDFIPSPKSKAFEYFVFKVNLLISIANDDNQTLYSVLAHEVAHAYLHSYKIKYRESELMTDVCAMAAGFWNYYAKMNEVRFALSKKGLEKTFQSFTKEQIENLKRGGNEYISKWEILFTRFTIIYFALKK
jgi:hypothetical protein